MYKICVFIYDLRHLTYDDPASRLSEMKGFNKDSSYLPTPYFTDEENELLRRTLVPVGAWEKHTQVPNYNKSQLEYVIWNDPPLNALEFQMSDTVEDGDRDDFVVQIANAVAILLERAIGHTINQVGADQRFQRTLRKRGLNIRRYDNWDRYWTSGKAIKEMGYHCRRYICGHLGVLSWV